MKQESIEIKESTCDDCACNSCKNIECKENNTCRGCHEFSKHDHMVDLGSCVEYNN